MHRPAQSSLQRGEEVGGGFGFGPNSVRASVRIQRAPWFSQDPGSSVGGLRSTPNDVEPTSWGEKTAHGVAQEMEQRKQR